MTVPEDVREVLVQSGLQQSQATRTDVELVVDSVLAHLEPRGWYRSGALWEYPAPGSRREVCVYSIRKDAP